MKLDSREFQCQLDGLRFADRPSGIKAFFSFVSGFDPHVSLHADNRKKLEFEVFFLDTAGVDFAAQQIHLRVRVFSDRLICTHKAIASDRYWLKKMRVACSAKNAKAKLEEDIYGYHSMFAWEMSCSQPPEKRFPTVGDWAGLYEGAEDVSAADRPLAATPSRFFYQVTNIELHFDGRDSHKKCKAAATLEFKYEDSRHEKLLAVEFAWKHIRPGEKFASHHVRRMRRFFAALLRSPWADSSSDLAKCQEQSL